MIGAILAVLFLLVSCGSGSSENGSPELDITSPTGAATVYGKIIDVSTRSGVTGATAKLFIKDNIFTASTIIDDAVTTDIDESGDFEFQGVASGTHKLRVEADGYAVYETWLTVNAAAQGAYYFAVGTDGKIELSRDCNVDVYVSSEGAVLGGVHVFASGTGSPEIASVTDDSGYVALKGFSQTGLYNIVAVATDVDGDNIYDYTNAGASYSCINSDKTLSLDMSKSERDDSISLIGGSYEKYNVNNVFGWAHTVAPQEPIVLVFNYPINVDTNGLILSYYRNLVLSSDEFFEKTIDIPTEVSLSAGNTILTLTHTEPLIENETYSLMGAITANIYGEVSYWSSSLYWYVFRTDGISNDSIIRSDNHNGHTGEAGFLGTVYLKFPEYVYGTAIISSYTENGVAKETALSVYLDDATLTTDEDVNGCSGGVCGSGDVYYRVRLTGLPLLDDDSVGLANNVTVFVDATDSEGNRIQREYVLPVE